MNDRPDAVELLGAVERFLRDELLPELRGTRRYQARVAANVVGIVAREIGQEDASLRVEWGGLAALLGRSEPAPPERDALRAAVLDANQALAARIRAGEADAGAYRRDVIAHLKRVVEAKLAVSLPPDRR